MESLETGFLLDRRWHWMRGEMETSKEPDLALLARILSEQNVTYAVIGGVALQAHQHDPRSTLDIELGVLRREDIPREALAGAGFRETGKHAHSENWTAPGGTPVQFTDDPALSDALGRALEIRIGDVPLRVMTLPDLFHEKLRSGRDPARRRSKRLQDLADAQALLEQHADLAGELRPDERDVLDRLP